LIKLVLVTATVYSLYDYQFIVINFSTMTLYFIANYMINEWRSKYFKDKTMKDSGYNQKAIDSLINFETVKYFNAEEHESKRFYKSLLEYKEAQIKMVYSRRFL
jgi:ABC-type transport system involved in Fe-S cluster assembly fused permease/ATPase subunit